MKRTIKQRYRLPAFWMSIAELEALVGRLHPLFGDEEVSWEVDVKLRNEELTFESFDEIRASKDLPDSVTMFDLWMKGGARRVWVSSGNLRGSSAAVDAEADDAAWCAGVVEVTRQFIASHQRWYARFRGWPIGAGVLLLGNVPAMLLLTPLKAPVETATFHVAWVALFLVFVVLYFVRGRLLPAATLQIRQTDSTLRRYLPEITLAVSLFALLLVIIGWFFE